MKTELTITIKLSKDAFDEAKRQNAGNIKELIEEALSDVFNTTVDAIKWASKTEEVEKRKNNPYQPKLKPKS